MRYWKLKLALFFTVQTGAVAVMISLSRAGVEPGCDLINECARPTAPEMLLAIALILGELAAVAGILRHHVPVWYSLVGLGAVSLVVAFVFGIAAAESLEASGLASQLAIWHVVLALILLAVNAIWFQRRVLDDEARLLKLFGTQYANYQARVKRWIPGVF